MTGDQNSSLFNVGLSTESKSHLHETAKWASFLAICGMIIIVLMVVMGVFVAFSFSKLSGQLNELNSRDSFSTTGFGAGIAIFYILIGLLYFFPCLFTLQFANKMKAALLSGDELLLSESFRSLKKTFRYMGILMIIGLVFLLMALISGGLTAFTGV